MVGRSDMLMAIRLVGVLGISSMAMSAHSAGNPEQLFKQCQSCHAIGPDAANQFGPHLNGLAERPAGVLDGYDFSQAFASVAATGAPWTVEALDAYLQAPMDNIPGTKMAFLGVKDEAERSSLIEWLMQIGADGSMPESAITEAPKTSQADVPRVPAADVPVPEHGIFHLGRVALDEEIAAWDIDVRPDGQGLPPGEGSAIAGGELYDAQCAVCHGVFGEGEGRWPILAGGFDTLTDERPEKTIGSYWPYLSTVYDYVKRAMPFGNARSLSDDDVYALTAYLLYLNDLAEEDFVLSSENFNTISLPNEANFIADNRSEEPQYADLTEPCMQDCKPEAAVVTKRAQVLDVTPDTDDGESSGAGSID